MQENWVVLKVFDNSMDAGLAKSVLEQNGIVCVVASEGMSLYPSLGVGGNRLMVHVNDAAQARETLGLDEPVGGKFRPVVIKGGKT